MHIPNNLPSLPARTLHRESVLRFQTPSATMRSPTKLKRVPNLVSRAALQSFVCLAMEPEDAKITGATRSLSRRLLALNMPQMN